MFLSLKIKMLNQKINSQNLQANHKNYLIYLNNLSPHLIVQIKLKLKKL
jgi:hypothetical protein